MIKALLFDLGGTLHTVQHSQESRRHFCVHLLELLKEHGIVLDTDPETLDRLLAVNGVWAAESMCSFLSSASAMCSCSISRSRDIRGC